MDQSIASSDDFFPGDLTILDLDLRRYLRRNFAVTPEAGAFVRGGQGLAEP